MNTYSINVGVHNQIIPFIIIFRKIDISPPINLKCHLEWEYAYEIQDVIIIFQYDMEEVVDLFLQKRAYERMETRWNYYIFFYYI